MRSQNSKNNTCGRLLINIETALSFVAKAEEPCSYTNCNSQEGEMLKPLQQFVCDKCGLIIESPKDGWVEWLGPDEEIDGIECRQYKGFKVVHHASASPQGGCYHYGESPYKMDGYLADYMGEAGIGRLMTMLELGQFHSPGLVLSRVSDLREYVVFFNRLHISYYEEARLYFDLAHEEFDGINEFSLHHPDTLKRIIAECGDGRFNS